MSWFLLPHIVIASLKTYSINSRYILNLKRSVSVSKTVHWPILVNFDDCDLDGELSYTTSSYIYFYNSSWWLILCSISKTTWPLKSTHNISIVYMYCILTSNTLVIRNVIYCWIWFHNYVINCQLLGTGYITGNKLVQNVDYIL